MNEKTAFVASTLPAKFLLDNLTKLKINRVVCASDSLSLSFEYLSKKFSHVKIIAVSKTNRKDFIKQEVLNSKANGIVVFHECCWLDLDIAILDIQPLVLHFPCVTLDSFKLLTRDELNIPSLLKRVFDNKNKTTLRLLLNYVKHNKDFNFYEVCDDNNANGASYVSSLKKSSVKNLVLSNQAQMSRNSKNNVNYRNNSKNIILIVATDVVSSKSQRELFNKIAKICEKFNYNILVKDHPNPAARLNLVGVGTEISPYIPFEVLEEPYLYKIGLFSTTLVFEASRSISIANLFKPWPEEFTARKSHLAALPDGNLINFVKEIDELENIFKKIE